MADLITGDKQLDRQLLKLATRDIKRIQRNAVNKALTVISKAIRNQAPVGKTRGLKKSIGKRFKRKKRTGEIEAKAGIHVGKKKAKLEVSRGGLRGLFGAKRTVYKTANAPHAHLVAAGTTPRYTKRGAYRGVMPSNDFVDRGYDSSKAQALEVQRQAFADGIRKAVDAA